MYGDGGRNAREVLLDVRELNIIGYPMLTHLLNISHHNLNMEAEEMIAEAVAAKMSINVLVYVINKGVIDV